MALPWLHVTDVPTPFGTSCCWCGNLPKDTASPLGMEPPFVQNASMVGRAIVTRGIIVLTHRKEFQNIFTFFLLFYVRCQSKQNTASRSDVLASSCSLYVVPPTVLLLETLSLERDSTTLVVVLYCRESGTPT
jgi:hypothetical protein